jgi:hypothetical protein
VGFDHHGGHQAQHRGIVGKDAHHVCPPIDLTVEALEWKLDAFLLGKPGQSELPLGSSLSEKGL